MILVLNLKNKVKYLIEMVKLNKKRNNYNQQRKASDGDFILLYGFVEKFLYVVISYLLFKKKKSHLSLGIITKKRPFV